MSDTKDLILGMKRALNAMEDCDGDLDFAIFVVKKDIAALEDEAESEDACEGSDPCRINQETGKVDHLCPVHDLL